MEIIIYSVTPSNQYEKVLLKNFFPHKNLEKIISNSIRFIVYLKHTEKVGIVKNEGKDENNEKDFKKSAVSASFGSDHRNCAGD